MPELRLTRRAKRDLQALSAPVREAVLNMLTSLAADPEASGKELLGRLKGTWSARVGSYRVLYTIEPAGVVRAIQHRAVAYRKPVSVGTDA